MTAEDRDKLHATIRSLHQFEAEQANRRLSWLGSMQGFLFGSLAIGWEKDARLAKLIAGLGITVSILIFFGMMAGVLAILRLRKRWIETRDPESESTDVFSFFPDSDPWLVFSVSSYYSRLPLWPDGRGYSCGKHKRLNQTSI